MRKCPRKSIFAVPWAGEIKMACEIHANDLRVLGNVIGSPVEVRPVVTGEPCYGQDDFAERKAANQPRA